MSITVDDLQAAFEEFGKSFGSDPTKYDEFFQARGIELEMAYIAARILAYAPAALLALPDEDRPKLDSLAVASFAFGLLFAEKFVQEQIPSPA